MSGFAKLYLSQSFPMISLTAEPRVHLLLSLRWATGFHTFKSRESLNDEARSVVCTGLHDSLGGRSN